MICKRLAAFAVTLCLLGAPAVLAAGGSGTDIACDRQAVAGTVPRLLTAVSDNNSQSVECSLGDAVADAVRIYLKTDIAIVNGGDLVANLPSGGITWDELRSAFAENRPLATATVTVRQLREILEAGLSHIRMNDSEKIDSAASAFAGFPQISGFTLFYDVSEPPGRRVHDIIMGDKSINLDDDTTTVTLAATSFMLEGGYGLPAVDTMVPSGLTLADVTARYINDGTADYLNTGKRINAMGTADIPVSGGLIAGIVVVVLVFSVLRSKRKLTRFSNFRR